MHNFSQDSQKVITHLESQLNLIKTGRANPAILDTVMVMAWGSRSPLNQVATVSVADATMLIVKPYDRSLMKDIEKGIVEAGLGINPIVDSEVIRLPIPPLTEETRKTFVKKAKDIVEEGRIALRQSRVTAKQLLEKMKSDKLLTEDQLESEEKKLQIEVDKMNEKIEEMLKAKEQSLLQI
jgi:ribosome recycling factor